MSLLTAKKALNENLRLYVSARSDPKAYNETIALLNIVKALQTLEASVVHVSQQVAALRR
jgi:hypothetical protein